MSASGPVAEQGQELAALVHGEDHGDAVGFADLLVVFTVGGSLVDDAGAVGGGDVVGHEDLPGVGRAPLFGVGEVVPQRLVAQAGELLAQVHGGDGRAGGSRRRRTPGPWRRQPTRSSASRKRPGRIVLRGAVGAGGHDGVADGGPDGEGHGWWAGSRAWWSRRWRVTPSSSAESTLSPAVIGKVTVTVWSWRSL